MTGFFVIQRGLFSLDALIATVKRMTLGSLNERIDPAKLPPELRRLGLAFNEMLARMEASLSHLKHMADDLAHELKTPIASLSMQLELLLTSERDPVAGETLASALEELQKMTLLVENILFLARTDGRHVQLEREPVMAEAAIGKIMEYYQPLCEEKKMDFQLAGSAQLLVHPIMFSRLINNIISNAVQYCPDHSQVKVAVTQDPDHVQIVVADNGPGIAAVHLPHLFERFYRVDAARSGAHRGTGLGLAIAQSIVRLHGGRIEIESVSGQGTQVNILLPCQPA